MRALVLSDEDAETYGKYLQKLPTEQLNNLTYDTYVQDCVSRSATACESFTMTNSGFHAEADLAKPNLVFFSVPYDDGFTAYVNGEEAEIVRVDEGLMAVLCPEGASSIDFVYEADGLSLSKKVTFVAIPVFVCMLAISGIERDGGRCKTLSTGIFPKFCGFFLWKRPIEPGRQTW